MPTIGLKPASINIRLGKKRDRSQMCKIYTDDGRRVTHEGDVEMGCILDHDRRKAFLQDPDNQFRSLKDGQWYQILGERSSIPICLIKPTNVDDLKKSFSKIYRACKENAKFQQYIDAKKQGPLDKLIWLAAIGISGMVLYYAMRHFWG